MEARIQHSLTIIWSEYLDFLLGQRDYSALKQTGGWVAMWEGQEPKPEPSSSWFYFCSQTEDHLDLVSAAQMLAVPLSSSFAPCYWVCSMTMCASLLLVCLMCGV